MTKDARRCRYCPATLKDYRGRIAHEMMSHPDQYEDDTDEAEVCRDYLAVPRLTVEAIIKRHRIANARLYEILATHGIERRQRPKAKPKRKPSQRTRNPPMVKRYPKGGVTPWRELLA